MGKHHYLISFVDSIRCSSYETDFKKNLLVSESYCTSALFCLYMLVIPIKYAYTISFHKDNHKTEVVTIYFYIANIMNMLCNVYKMNRHQLIFLIHIKYTADVIYLVYK
jgi:hypothetical protein